MTNSADIDLHAILLDKLTQVLDETLDERRRNAADYNRSTQLGQFRRDSLANDLCGLRKAIRHTQREAVRARLAAVA